MPHLAIQVSRSGTGSAGAEATNGYSINDDGFWLLMLANCSIVAVCTAIADALMQRIEAWLAWRAAEQRAPADHAALSPRTLAGTRLGPGAPVTAARDITLAWTGAAKGAPRLRRGQKGAVLRAPGGASGSVAQVTFMTAGELLSFDAMPGDVLLLEQGFDLRRMLRMVFIIGAIFAPISFTWYALLLPLLVPSASNSLSAMQMFWKIVWDVLLYGTVVVVINITNNAALQAYDADIRRENEQQGVSPWQHIARRLAHDLWPMWWICTVLSILEDIPGFLLIPDAWQSLAFKVGDLFALVLMCFIVNQPVDAQLQEMAVNCVAEPAGVPDGHYGSA